MSESMIVGVDHGYAAMKTAHFSFPSGLVAYEHEPYTLKDVLEYGGIAPWVRADCRHLMAGCLTGGEGQCVFVVNIDPARKAVEGASLQLAFDCTSAVWATPQGETALTMQGRRVLLPRVEEGGMVMLH